MRSIFLKICSNGIVVFHSVWNILQSLFLLENYKVICILNALRRPAKSNTYNPCDGLNVCVPPKFLCCNPNTQCDGIIG